VAERLALRAVVVAEAVEVADELAVARGDFVGVRVAFAMAAAEAGAEAAVETADAEAATEETLRGNCDAAALIEGLEDDAFVELPCNTRTSAARRRPPLPVDTLDDDAVAEEMVEPAATVVTLAEPVGEDAAALEFDHRADAEGEGATAAEEDTASDDETDTDGVTDADADAEAEAEGDGDGVDVGDGVGVGEFDAEVPGDTEAADEAEAFEEALAEGMGTAASEPGGTKPLAPRS
jgi:hypothetical protein